MSLLDNVCEVKSDLEVDTEILETVLLNSKNEKAKRYIREAVQEMYRAAALLSDAEFDMSTSWDDDEDEEDDE